MNKKIMHMHRYLSVGLLLAVIICVFIFNIFAPSNENADVDSSKIEDVETTNDITVEYPEETIVPTNVTPEPEPEPELELISEFKLTDYERWIVECIVMGESGGEPYEGQMLVAQCILNACLKDDIMPSEVKEKYKYSGWNESPTDSIKKAVVDVFDNGYKVTDELIMYFYAPKYSQGRWHETQRFVIELGGHRFFAEWE